MALSTKDVEDLAALLINSNAIPTFECIQQNNTWKFWDWIKLRALKPSESLKHLERCIDFIALSVSVKMINLWWKCSEMSSNAS